MRITTDIALNHAWALARNFSVGNPSSHRDLMADYVAENMVEFITSNDNVDELPEDRQSWYAHAIVNYGV